jgi:CRP-like cAMP-binding protein
MGSGRNKQKEVPVFDNGLNPINAAALEDCEVWIIEAELLRRGLARYPELAQSVIANLSQNLRTLLGMVEELTFYQVVNRLARLINQMPTDIKTGVKTGWLTQDELAARLGTMREVVTRSLRVLERSGAIRVNRRQVVVVDEARLREWAQGPWN